MNDYRDPRSEKFHTPKGLDVLENAHQANRDNLVNRHEELKKKLFHPSGDRGFHHSDIHKAAEELRMEGKGSEDPHYEDSKKNKS